MNLSIVLVCALGLRFIDYGNGNHEPPEAVLYWASLYAVIVAPPYLVITKALARRRRTRRVVLALWLAFAGYMAMLEFKVYTVYMLSTW